MFNFTAAISSTLAAALILTTLAPVAQASDNTSTRKISKANKATSSMLTDLDNYCTHDIRAQTLHPKYQSKRQCTMNGMLTQLRVYQQPSMTAQQQYFAYKAQAWLNYAYHEDSIKSITEAGTLALQASATILQALEQDKSETLDITTDIPTTSTLMRPDLWATIIALKDAGGIESAPRELAFSEVALIWAAAEQCTHGWRQSGAHFRMADRWLEQAREAYINAHDSATNVKLEDLINSYYKQYALLDMGDDRCLGQSLPLGN